MRRILFLAMIILIACPIAGCYDRLDMEDASFALSLGMDLDKNNKLVLFNVYPVFEKNVKKTFHESISHGGTFRKTRTQADSLSAGAFQARKVQVMLISKKVLKHHDWFQLLDVFFRDAKNPLTVRIIAYDGPLAELVRYNPANQPMLPLLLRKMIDTKSARNETVRTTMQDLHWQMYEKGITPSISEVGLGAPEEIVLLGTALLDHRGKYVKSLNAQESVLLKVVQDDAKKSSSLTLTLPGVPLTGPFETNKISLSTNHVETKIAADYRHNKFQFDIRIKMWTELSEVLFPLDQRYTEKELEKILAAQLKKEIERLIRSFQKHSIDPIGLGRYARAYQYEQFKKVQDQWSESFAKAEVHIDTKIRIQSSGPVRLNRSL